jgi:hypothetical protein
MVETELINGRHTKRWRSGFEERFGPNTGIIIRDYLKERGGIGYPYEAWNYYRERLKESIQGKVDHKLEVEYHVATYQSFYRYFYILENLGLIRKSGNPQHGKAKIPRQYYEVTSAGVFEERFDPLWKHPQVLLYPITRLGKRRYTKFKERIENFIRKIEESINKEIKLTPYQFILLEDARELGIAEAGEFLIYVEELGLMGEYYDLIEDLKTEIGYTDVLRNLRPVQMEEIVENLWEMERTLPYVRKPILPPDVKKLQEEIKAREEELKECMVKADELRKEIEEMEKEIEEEKIPVTMFTPIINEVVNAITKTGETYITTPLEEETSNIFVLLDRWEDLENDERKRICKAIDTIPEDFMDEAMEIEEFEELVKKCLER